MKATMTGRKYKAEDAQAHAERIESDLREGRAKEEENGDGVDWLSTAEAAYRGYLLFDLGLEDGSRKYETMVRQIRRALGYTNP